MIFLNKYILLVERWLDRLEGNGTHSKILPALIFPNINIKPNIYFL